MINLKKLHKTKNNKKILNQQNSINWVKLGN